jgi:hypothetical protein
VIQYPYQVLCFPLFVNFFYTPTTQNEPYILSFIYCEIWENLILQTLLLNGLLLRY